MFLGHFGVGLAAKAAAPRTSLAVLVAAGECLDLLWLVLLLTGLSTCGSSRASPRSRPSISATRSDHPLPADDVEMQRLSCLTRQ